MISYPDIRMCSVSSFDSLDPSWLRLSQNNAIDDGGTCCYDDSVGPNFIGARRCGEDDDCLDMVTGDALCKATTVSYRLETPAAQVFLGQVVALP